MAKNAVSDWDSTAANNTEVGGIDISEGCAPANINNAIREVMAQVKGTLADFLYPVGSLYMSTTNTNPGTFLGGTWVAYATGRALVGVGTSDSSDAYAWTGGQKRGNETHTLTTAELAAHTHSVDPPSTTTSSAGAHTHTDQYKSNESGTGGTGVREPWSGASVTGTITTDSAGAHTHTVNIGAFNSASTGSGNAHNNLQPSIAVYVWHRTA